MHLAERRAQFQFSLKFSAHINIFWQHYLGDKKQTFLACNSKQVYATFLESSKINSLFQNRQIYSCRISEISQNFLNMASVSLQM